MPFVIKIEREGIRLKEGLLWDWPMLSLTLTACLAEACPEVLDEITDGRWSEHKEVSIEDATYETYVDMSMVPIYHVPWQVPVLREGRQTLTSDHEFYVPSREDEDKRKVQLKKGDTIIAYREFK